MPFELPGKSVRLNISLDDRLVEAMWETGSGPFFLTAEPPARAVRTERDSR